MNEFIQETTKKFLYDWNGGMFLKKGFSVSTTDPQKIEKFIALALGDQANDFKKLLKSKKKAACCPEAKHQDE